MAGLVRIQRTAFHRRSRRGTVAIHPTVEGATVEEQYPPVPLFMLCERVLCRNFFHADVSVAHEFLRAVAAAVNLERNAAGIGMALLGLGPFHEFHTIDPGGDGGRIADDARSQFVPLSMTPEAGPTLRTHGQRKRRLLRLDISDSVEESKVHHIRLCAERSFSVQAHQISSAVIINHRLKGGTILCAAQKQSTV